MGIALITNNLLTDSGVPISYSTSGTSGIAGSSGTSGANGIAGSSGTSGTKGTSGTTGTSGTSGANGSSGTSGTGFSTITNPVDNRILTSLGTTNTANAEANLTFDGTNLVNVSSTGGIFAFGLQSFKQNGSLTNTVIPSDTSQVAQSPISPYLWHDVFSFGLYSPQYQTSADGITYNSATLNNNLFAQKQNQNIEIINGTTILSARWIWTGVSFNSASWLCIGFTYTVVSPAKTIVFESSADNVTWTVRHTSSNTYNAIPAWFYITTFGGDNFVRLTITTTNASSVRISSIRLLTSRWGDQGLGSEIEFPYAWDANKNIGIGGNADASSKLNIVGPTLGTTLGNQSLVQKLQVNTGSVDLLELTNTRVVNGTSWTSAGFRIQQKVDSTWLGYLQFNGSNDAGVSFGTGYGASATSVVERMRITSDGYVIIGTQTSNGARFQVTGTATFSSSVTANSLIKSGGTSTQFLKADGSIDSNTYLTTSSASSTYLPLAGGTLTGALNGTTATFTGNIRTTGATAEIIANGAGSSNTVGGSSRFTILDSTNNRGWILQQDATYDLAFWHLNGGAWTNNIIFSPTGTISVNGESTYIGTDAQAVPRLGFVKIGGQNPFLGFASVPFTIRVSGGADIATSNTFTTALSIATDRSATFSSTVSATDYYFNSSSLERAVKRYVSTANVSNAGYTVVCNVTGNALASAVRMTLQGTTGSVVINVTADILVNHSQDILITSQAGIYTLLTLRVISNNDENFSVEATSNSPNVCTMNVEVYPLNNETVTFGGSAQTGSTLTHVCTPGVNISATGGSNGDFAASGNGTFGGTLGVTGAATLSSSVFVGSTLRLTQASAVDIQAYTGSAYTNLNYDALSHNWQTGGGAAKMVLTNGGNVGIGTSSPSEKLDVIGGAVAAGNGTIRTGITYSSLGLIGTFTNHDLGVITNGTERMRITSGGEVIVGGPTTNATLSISGDNSAGDTFLNFKADIGQTKAQIQGSKFAGTGGVLYFKTLQSSILTTVMTINQASQVLINTAGITGGGALQVNGNVNINGVFQINGVTIGGGGGSGVTGSGTTNYIPKWSSASSIGNSIMYESGTGIGIGITNPLGYSKLSLGTGIGAKFLVYDNGTNVFAGLGQDLAAGNSTDLFAHGAGGGFLTFGRLGTNGLTYTEWARITSGGNLGIGTANATGQASNNRVLQIYGAGTANRAQLHLVNSNTGEGTSDGTFIGIDDSTNLYINNSESAATIFENAGSERMRITSGGNVLIGTTTDAGYKLDVNGTGIFRNRLTISADAGNEQLVIQRASNTNAQLIFGYHSLGYGTIQAVEQLIGYKPLALNQNGGNVLIGTTTDSGYKLDVNGTGRFTSRILAGNSMFVGEVVSSFSLLESTSGNGIWLRPAGGSDPTGLKIATTGAATFSSSVTATSFFEFSDKRLKKEISDKPIISGIEAIKPKLYIKDGKEELGYYAQDLQEILPSAVIESEDGFLSLSYAQVLVAKVASLEKRIEELEAKLK